MAWKYNGEGDTRAIALDPNGNPIWVFDDGEVFSVDYGAVRAQINEMNTRLKASDVREKKLTEMLKGAEITDLAAFIKKAQDDAVIAASGGDKEKIKAQIAEASAGLNAKISQLEKTSADKDTQIAEFQTLINKSKISQAFANSKFVNEKIGDSILAEKLFADSFKVEDEKIIAFNSGGERMVNDKGDPDFDFAIQKLVDLSPFKDKIIKSGAPAGNGARGSWATKGNGDLSKLTETELIELLGDHPEMKNAVNAEFKRRITGGAQK
jgi:hypothetical protein